MSVHIRACGIGDIDAAANVLASAFEDDPYVGWLLPDFGSRVARARWMFSAVTRHHLLHGHVDIAVDADGAVRGAALWTPPGCWRHTVRSQARMLPDLLKAFGPRIPLLGLADRQKQRMHPSEPHWYLQAIGTSPAARGLGYGRSLLESKLALCDREGVSAFLETSNKSNLAYYERFGFTVFDEITMRFGGPRAWLMWRPPQPGGRSVI
ncbi:GNAT family N-acetyltransferase [Nocardia sp. NPDC056000]|uniref:GNAT family N-acetyltransferase n=1 Tax=Nocardia sp. NPDC056000 TaxID=3345674 RepID=UPI0035D6360C